MKNLNPTDKLSLISSYYLKVMPDIKKYLRNAEAAVPKGLRDPRARREKMQAVCRINELRSSGILILSNNDISDYNAFVVSLHILCNYLDKILESRELTDISQIQELYLPFLEAVDPDLQPVFDSGFYCSTEITAYLKKLSKTCREKIAALPNYKMVTGKMRKYARLYMEYQSCKYQPLKTRAEHLRMWSEYYIRQFPGISFWEFAASADSMLGICAMYISAKDPGLTEEYINKLDSTYMPWVCAYQKMLHYYIHARDDIMTSRMNLTDFYQNLRHCEERIRFLGKKALDSCIQLPDANIHTALVQAVPVIYLSDPRASFGLNRLASRHIIRDSSALVRSIWNCSRFINAFK